MIPVPTFVRVGLTALFACASLLSYPGVGVASEETERVLQTSRVTDLVTKLAFSPDGTLLVCTANNGGPVDVWDVSCRQLLMTLEGYPQHPLDLYFAHDGRMLVAEYGDGYAVWRLADRRRRWQRRVYPDVLEEEYPDTGPDGVYAMALSRTGTLTARATFVDGVPHVRVRAENGDLRFEREGLLATHLLFDPTSTSLLTQFLFPMQIWDLETGTRRLEYQHPGGRMFTRPVFSHDGRHIALVRNASQGDALEIAVRSVEDGEEWTLATEEVVPPALVLLTELSGPALYYARAADASVARWDVEAGTTRTAVPRDEFGTMAFALEPRAGLVARSLAHPVGRQIVRGIEFHTLGTGQGVGRLRSFVSPPLSVALDPRTDRLYAHGDWGIYRWALDTAEREPVQVPLEDHLIAIRGKRCLSHDDGTRNLRSALLGSEDSNTFDCLPEGPALGTWHFGASEDLSRVAIATPTEVVLGDVRANRIIRRWPRVAKDTPPTRGRGTVLRFVRGDRELLVADDHGHVERWDAGTGRLLYHGHHPAFVSRFIQDRSALNDLLEGRTPDEFLIGGEVGLYALRPGQDADLIYRDPVGRCRWDRAHERLLVGGYGLVLVLDPEAGAETLRIEDPTYQGGPLFFWNRERWIAWQGTDGAVHAYDARTGRPIATFVPVGAEQSIVMLDSGHYAATRGGVFGVAHRLGAQIFPFDEFDADWNRPDVVLEALDVARPERRAQARDAHARRLVRLGRTADRGASARPRPRVRFVPAPPSFTNDRKLRLRLEAASAGSPLEALHVYANRVPILGRAGLALDGRVDDPIEVDIDLIPGENHLQIAVVDAKGGRSFHAAHVVTCLAPPEESAVYFLGVGVSKYAESARNLRYAAKDLRDVEAMLRRNYGPRLRSRLLTNADACREDVLASRALFDESKPGDIVMLYLSGHGVRDASDVYYFAPHDLEFADPSSGGIAFDAFEDLLDGIPARRRLVFMDSCHAGDLNPGAIARADGARRDAGVVRALGVGQPRGPLGGGSLPTTSVLREAFVDLRRGSGAVVIAAAGGAEFAYEGTDWRNGVFTYAVLRGVGSRLADRDEDGRILATEIEAFVADEVRRLTKGMQRPALKRENAALDIPIVTARVGVKQTLDRGSFEPTGAIAVSPDGRRVAVDRMDGVRVYALAGDVEPVHVKKPDTNSLDQFWFSPGGHHLLGTTFGEGRLVLLDTERGTSRTLATNGDRLIGPVAHGERGSHLVLNDCGEPGHLGILDLDAEVPRVRTWAPESGGVRAAAVTADGRRAVLVLDRRRVRELDLSTLEVTSRSDLAWDDAWGSPQLDHLVAGAGGIHGGGIVSSGPRTRHAVVWDLASGTLLLRRPMTTDAVVVLTGDTVLLLRHPLQTSLRTLVAWRLGSEDPVLSLEEKADAQPVLSSDGSWLLLRRMMPPAFGAPNPAPIRLFHLPSGREMGWLLDTEAGLESITFTRDGRRLLLLEDAREVRIHELP